MGFKKNYAKFIIPFYYLIIIINITIIINLLYYSIIIYGKQSTVLYMSLL